MICICIRENSKEEILYFVTASFFFTAANSPSSNCVNQMELPNFEQRQKQTNVLKNVTSLATLLLLLGLTVATRGKISPMLLYYFIFLFALNGVLCIYLFTRLLTDKPEKYRRAALGTAVQVVLNFGFALICYSLL